MKRKKKGPWEQKPSFNIKQISLVLIGCHLISNNNQTMETETLDPESQLVQAKYFSCKVGVLRKKLDLLFGIFNKSNETLKWKSSEPQDFQERDENHQNWHNWKPPPQRGVEGVCGRRCIFGRTGCYGRSFHKLPPPPLAYPPTKRVKIWVFLHHLLPFGKIQWKILQYTFKSLFTEITGVFSFLKTPKSLTLVHWTPWKNWFNSTRKGGQIKRSEKQSSCTYRGGCVVHEWLQAVIGRYYRGGRRAVVDQDI